MAIAAYYHPKGMTYDQFADIHRRLEAAGWGLRDQKGRLHHSCIGQDGDLMVYDVWESQEAFENFGRALMPLLGEAGIEVPPPDVMEVKFIDQTTVEGKF